jgi:glycosyltransferase involved in cell wall biosynthesis/ubiquinone/menaquinone biosynthesis C-methylase UbiE
MHTTQCSNLTIHNTTSTYVDYIKEIKKHFSLVVASIGYEDVRRGNWIAAFEQAGIPWIAGAWSHDKNALIRVQTLMRQFEFATSNNPGSHFAYAAYSGCKMSYAGPDCETLKSELDTHPYYRKYPELAKLMKRRDHIEELRTKFPFFFVEPKNATTQVEWAEKELGKPHKKHPEEIAELFEWKIRKVSIKKWAPINEIESYSTEKLFAKAYAKSLTYHHDEAFKITEIIISRNISIKNLEAIRARYFLSIGDIQSALNSLEKELQHFPDNDQAANMFKLIKTDLLTQSELISKNEREFISFYSRIHLTTPFNIKRSKSLYALAVRICQENVPGNFVECGEAAGGSAMLLALVVQKHSRTPRKVFAFDTFTGMPDHGEADTAQGIPADETGWGAGTCAAPEEFVLAQCRRLGVDGIVETRKGLFDNARPLHRDEIGEIALLHMDADLYSSTMTILNNLFFHLNSRGLIQIDGYEACDGCKKAINDFSRINKLNFEMHEIDDIGVWCTKPEQTSAEKFIDVTNTTFINPILSQQFSDIYFIRKAILDRLDKSTALLHGTVLDVGCGQMPYKNYIIKANPCIKKYIGLDFAQGKYADIKQPDITWDGQTIPLDSASIDCSIATEVLEHCHHPLTVLKEIQRVLKPDGVFFFTVPFIWPLHDTPHDHYRYTPFSLKLLLQEAGFEDIQINSMGGWDASLAQMIGLWLKRAPMTDDIRQQMSQKLFPLFKQLVELDSHDSANQHTDNCIAPGWSGIAYKPFNNIIKPTEHTSELSLKKLCIVRHEHFAYSQTFIEDHISYISKNSSVIHGESYPMFDQNQQCIFTKNQLNLIINNQYSISKNIYTDTLHNYLKDNKFEVILAEFGIVAAKIYNACKKSGIPYVVHFHGYDATATPTLQTYKKEYSDIFQSAAALIVVSKAMREKIISIGAPIDKVFLNPYGVDVQRVDLASPESSQPIFLAVGRFVEKKAPHLTIQAFEKTAKSIPNSRLVMVGDGPLLKTCQELARKLTIDNQVQFAGVHTRRSVAKLLRLSRAFVQHSVTAGNGDTEGLPLAILEAGAAGLPVISTRHAGIPDAVIEGENGLLVDEGDVQKMSEAMFQLAINPKLAGWMGKNYHQRVVDHFSRERSIQGLRAILRNATDTRQKSTSTRSQLRSEVSEPATTKNILETPNTLRYCPICQQTAQSFADFGRPSRKNAMCPHCGSLERHRFIWKYLQDHTDIFQHPDTQTLHFAPEPCLESKFRSIFTSKYITADLFDKKADVRIDITNIKFSDRSFSFIYCCHVLEHVPNDRKAMQEMYRILKQNGLAAIMVPIKGDITDEDFSITNPAERLQRYGLEDHVRYYGMDIVSRLQEVGFQVDHIEPQDIFTHKDIEHMSLGGGKLLLCRK